MEVCTECHEMGYLYKEKPRQTPPKKHYTQSRVRHGYWYYVHNIRVSVGHWKTRKCYIGLSRRKFNKLDYIDKTQIS